MKIFISYRRDDTQHSTGRLYERLVQAFGRKNVFKDVDSIPPGADFRDLLTRRVTDASVMLAIIGANWQGMDGQNRSRLENSSDFVRIELEDAMKRNISIIPVLVDGASVPAAEQLPESLRALTFRQSVVLRPDPDFSTDAERIIRHLQGEAANGVTDNRRLTKTVAGSLTAVAALAIMLSIAFFTRGLWMQPTKPANSNETSPARGKQQPSNETPGFELGRQFIVLVSVDDLRPAYETRTRQVTGEDGKKRAIQEKIQIPIQETREVELLSDVWPKVAEVTREGKQYYRVETKRGTQELTTYSRRAPEIRPVQPYRETPSAPTTAPAPPADAMPTAPPASPETDSGKKDDT